MHGYFRGPEDDPEWVIVDNIEDAKSTQHFFSDVAPDGQEYGMACFISPAAEQLDDIIMNDVKKKFEKYEALHC